MLMCIMIYINCERGQKLWKNHGGILQNHTRNVRNWDELTSKIKTSLISKFPKTKNEQKKESREELRIHGKDTNYKYIWRYIKINQKMNIRIVIKYMKNGKNKGTQTNRIQTILLSNTT